MERHINTYQGMNKDTAYDSIDPTLYIDALDIRITTTTGESMGAWTNIKGNVEAFTIPTDSEDAFPVGEPFGPWTANNPEIIGYTTIRNRIILFVADDSDAKGWIYDVQYNTATREILPGFPALKYYNGALNFEKKWPIEALGRYETDCVQRVYWTDYNNFFRTVNLEDPDLETTPVGNIDIFPDLEYTQPLLKIIGSGSLATGEYQIAYRLITSDGKETLISPPSNLIHVVSDSENLTQSAQYNGDALPVNSGKALQIEIDTSIYQDFAQIEFISIYHETLNSTPLVLSVEKVAIDSTSPIVFIYTGNEGTAFPIELLEYTIKNHPFKTPKTITQKDSSLVIANIKGSSISINDLLSAGETFDAKTRRYRNIGGIITPPNPIDPSPLDPTGNNLNNAFNILYNKDAHWDTNWHINEQYRYQSDGATLGGEGLNISYKFHLEPFTLDGEKATGQGGFANVSNTPDFTLTHDLNDGYGTYANTTFPNNASPFISGLLRGYKRGETYRFGIIFYTNKGEATFVEYIGDIKFPDISEKDSTVNISGTKYWPIAQADPTNNRNTIGYSMGIEFTIDFSSCPSIFNTIESYQIVRVKRTDADRRRAMQGIMKSFFFNNIQSPVGSFDFRAVGYGNNTNVLHILPNSRVFGSPSRFPHSFALLGDSENTFNTLPASTGDYLMKSQFIGFYAPELSFNFENYRNLASQQSGNPCLLMTGAFDGVTLYSTSAASGTPLAGTGVYQNFPADNGAGIPIFVDLTGEDLAKTAVDVRKKYCRSVAINYNSIENIKKLKETAFYSMPDNTDFQAVVTPLWNTGTSGGYHMRNYWAIDNTLDGSDHLNDPNGGNVIQSIAEVTKGGRSLLALTNQFFNDPLTNNTITSAPTDFFRIANNTSIPGGIQALYGTNPNSAINEYYPILDLVLPKQEVYGGYSTSALEGNTFIGASPAIELANTSPKVFGGDIFVTMFTCQTGTIPLDPAFFERTFSIFYSQYVDKYYGRAGSRTDVFPVETVMNLELAYGATLRTGVFYTYNSIVDSVILRQENDNSRTTYGKSLSMYAYNPLYTRENQEVTFVIEPENIKDCKVNDIRAYLSNVKINDETIDSWTKFGVNNFYDIDDYGPINKILNYKDTVYFFQDRGFGAYAINRAAITTTADGVPTQLGTGQGFGKHQYFSKTNGSIHQWGVKSTDTGIYIFDAIARKIFMFAASSTKSQNSPLSEMAGIHSFLQALPDAVFYRKENGGDNPVLKKGMTIGKDAINDEVIFTFLGSGDYELLTFNTEYTQGTVVYIPENNTYFLVTDTFTTGKNPLTIFLELAANADVKTLEELNLEDDTIVYDELMQKFSSRYSATPKIWIENSDILMSSDPSQPDTVYTHNIGNWGEFYGNTEECSISLVINPQADMNKVLRTIEFNSIVRDDNKVIDRTKTITAFRIQTQYQDTLKTPFSSGRIMRKFDKWRVKIPRDQLSVSKQGRLRSTYFILTLYFDNQDNKELITNRLMSYFDYQMF